MRVLGLFIASALALAIAAGNGLVAQQGWFFTPFVGGNFGGNA